MEGASGKASPQGNCSLMAKTSKTNVGAEQIIYVMFVEEGCSRLHFVIEKPEFYQIVTDCKLERIACSIMIFQKTREVGHI